MRLLRVSLLLSLRREASEYPLKEDKSRQAANDVVVANFIGITSKWYGRSVVCVK